MGNLGEGFWDSMYFSCDFSVSPKLCFKRFKKHTKCYMNKYVERDVENTKYLNFIPNIPSIFSKN